MRVITTLDEMRGYSREARTDGKIVGFVPTMGYLHDGHLSLIAAAREECDVVVVSIFVNPGQFSPDEDFDAYPRDMERDKKLAEGAGADIIFAPSAEDIYTDSFVTNVEITGVLTESLCGRSRPGHFKGVTTVVAKLFNIVEPDISYFGQKDAQQTVVIKKMVEDLNMPVSIRVMPVVREKDGLAMSSRNSYLSPEERHQALGLVRSLERAKEMTLEGEFSLDRIREEMTMVIEKGKDVNLDYIEIVDAQTLEPVESVKGGMLIAVAAFVGGTRLIDNVVIEKQLIG